MEEIKHTFKIERIMEDYTVDFQDVVDSFSLDELKGFKEKLVRVYEMRLSQELETTNERLKELNYMQENNLNTN